MNARRVLLLPALLLAACQPAPPASTDAAAVAPANSVAAPASAQVAATASVAAPAAGLVAPHDPAVIRFDGYGSARFGADEAAVRAVAGTPLNGVAPPASPLDCHILMDPPTLDGFRLAFMFEGGKFVRYDVDSRLIAAPGGLVVGGHERDVQAAFGDRASAAPHKYVPGGRVITVDPGDGSPARLVIETDEKGIITSWRIGLAPQVQYVEGCS